MLDEIILTIFFVMWYLLLAMSVLFIISGCDDLFFDVYYWVRYFWRIWKTRHYDPLTYEKLAALNEQLIAVLIPCWQESNIIASMLKYNTYSIDYKNYYFFVGVYPNDPETVAEVKSVAAMDQRIHCVMGSENGPTNKAANLNGIYQYVKKLEKKIHQTFTIYVFHDSEDMIHPLSFKLYNYLIPRKDMIQIPIFPMQVSNWNFTHWLYADEFAENHTKNIVVRESIRGHVPSAGVGTAFNYNALKILENSKEGGPFSINSLTEDYRTSLDVRAHKLKAIFVTHRIKRMQWRKRWFSRYKYIQKPVKEIVAIRALFPLQYQKSVRQKARWIVGIVFQEWQHSRWSKELKVCYTLAHDRKAFITHFINGFGYFIFTFWFIYSIATYKSPEYPYLQEQFNLYPWVWWIIVLSTVIMAERLLQRMIATFRIYGLIPALLVLPRAVYGNLLNLHALLRAYNIYFGFRSSKTTNKQLPWDKTENNFQGGHVLIPYRQKIGDLLLKNSIITEEQLLRAIIMQQKTGERLGQVLRKLNFITDAQLQQILSSQYNLPLFPHTKLHQAELSCKNLISKKMTRWLAKRGVALVNVEVQKETLTVAIHDPTNELLLSKIIKYLEPFKIKFVLIDMSVK